MIIKSRLSDRSGGGCDARALSVALDRFSNVCFSPGRLTLFLLFPFQGAGGGRGGRGRGGGGGRGGFQTPNLGNGTFGFKPTSMLSGNQPTVTSANANTNQQQVRFGQCMHCENTALHALDTCNKFLQADIQRRHDMMKRGGHCYKCLDRNHKAQDCSVDSLR